MYIIICLYIIITCMLWVLSIYHLIKHYTVVILCKSYNLIIWVWPNLSPHCDSNLGCQHKRQITNQVGIPPLMVITKVKWTN